MLRLLASYLCLCPQTRLVIENTPTGGLVFIKRHPLWDDEFGRCRGQWDCVQHLITHHATQLTIGVAGQILVLTWPTVPTGFASHLGSPHLRLEGIENTFSQALSAQDPAAIKAYTAR